MLKATIDRTGEGSVGSSLELNGSLYEISNDVCTLILHVYTALARMTSTEAAEVFREAMTEAFRRNLIFKHDMSDAVLLDMAQLRKEKPE